MPEENDIAAAAAMLELKEETIGLADLPGDVFVLIIEYLEAWEIVRCHMVCVAWREAFSAPEFLRIALKRYPQAREVKQLSPDGLLTSPPRGGDHQWRAIFDKVACRYFHLTHGKPRRIQKYKTGVPERMKLAHWFPVSPWDYHESQPGGRLYHLSPLEPLENHESRPGESVYLFRHSFWSCDDGLLAFAPRKPYIFDHEEAQQPSANATANFAIMVLDLESQHGVQVPFDLDGKVVRNLRLKDRTLIIEWAEKDPFHALNDSEYVHRHFASAYDIAPNTHCQGETKGGWTITFRSEWKLHFLGLPLNNRDRFFSTHTKNHYAVYFWQPNRSMYTGDEERPIECVLVWDITQPRKYLPSLDPGGRDTPDNADKGPHIVFRMNYRQLGYYDIRQQSSPSLINFSLDSEQRTIRFRENVCISGQGYFDPAERLWAATTTIIPFEGEGPHIQRQWDGNLPLYRGNCTMDTCDTLESENWFLGVMDVVDEEAHVRFSLAESVFTGRDVHNTAFVRIRALDKMATLDEATTRQIAYMGKIAGDERFLIGQNDSQEIVVLRFD
jgi:hypothetical protein